MCTDTFRCVKHVLIIVYQLVARRAYAADLEARELEARQDDTSESDTSDDEVRNFVRVSIFY